MTVRRSIIEADARLALHPMSHLVSSDFELGSELKWSCLSKRSDARMPAWCPARSYSLDRRSSKEQSSRVEA